MAKLFGINCARLITILLILFKLHFHTTAENLGKLDVKNEYNISTKLMVKSDNPNGNSTVKPDLDDTSYNINERPLLGVNGTGQRKEITTSPTIIADPIQTSNDKKKIIYPKKVLSTSMSSNFSTIDSSIEKVIDSIDVPENETLNELKNQQMTVNITTDHHDYYNSTIYVNAEQASQIWDSMKNISPNSMLSQSHRRAMTVELSFDFPFYGHNVRNITVATGGFLYTGEYVHSWLAATQYIAPLMANFDTSLSNNSFVRFKDNGNTFTVIWENVSLQDKQQFGNFTFSATLHKNGDIQFAYFSVPILVATIQDDRHPVKVGLSDAYIIDKVVYFARRKTIYEYHRVNFANAEITNSTIIYLKALPTCLSYTDCMLCINHDTNFDCAWCPALNRCSTGTDRKKQDWIFKGCDRSQVTEAAACAAPENQGNSVDPPHTANPTLSSTSTTSNSPDSDLFDPVDFNHNSSMQNTILKPANGGAMEIKVASNNDATPKSMGLALGFLFPVSLVFVVMLWILYAYRNPHTKSGQFLIQYRPSQWSWRRGEARYTAATIHM